MIMIKPYQMTLKQYICLVLDKNPLQLVNLPEWRDAHRNCVRDAIAADLDVPKDVTAELTDYRETEDQENA